MTSFRTSSDSFAIYDLNTAEIPGCVQEHGEDTEQQKSVSPPGQNPPLLPMLQGGSGSNAQKTMEEQFESLKFTLNLTREHALVAIRCMEIDNTRLLAENSAMKAQSGNSNHAVQRRETETALTPLRDTAQSLDDEASFEVTPAFQREISDEKPQIQKAASQQSLQFNQDPVQVMQSNAMSRSEKMMALKRSATRAADPVHQALIASKLNPSLGSRTRVSTRSESRFRSSVAERSIYDIENRFRSNDRVGKKAFKAVNSHNLDDSDEENGHGLDMYRLFRGFGTQREKSVTKEESRKPFTPQTVFADAEAMKDRVRTAMKRPEYNVHNMYKADGMAQSIARNPLFENFTLIVIAFNSLWIGIECDNNQETLITKVPIGFRIVDNFFCTYFLIEIIIRFAAFDRKKNAFQDAWFVFDLVMAFLYIFETWILFFIISVSGVEKSGNSAFKNSSVLRIMRLFRLTRMARISRLLRALPEVMILIKGVTLATRSVFFTLVLLIIIMYIFAVAFVQLTRETPVGKTYFDSVTDAMKTLLLNGTFLENIPDCYHSCADESELLGLALLVYVLLASLTVMNMLIGVLVDVVSVVATVEKESLVTCYVKQYLEKLWKDSGMDLNGDGMVSQEEFELLLEHPDATRCLNSVGVDVVGLVDFADFIFRGEEHNFVDFVELVLTLRGTNTARVKDIVDLRKYMAIELEHKLHLQECLVGDLADKIEAMIKAMVQHFETNQQGGRQFGKSVIRKTEALL